MAIETVKGLKGLKGISAKKQEELNTYWKNLETLARSTTGREFASTLPMQESTDVGMQLAELGVGESVYDDVIVNPGQLENIQDIRATEQGWGMKITNGVAKASVLAATTFADTVIGTLAGVANVIGNSLNGNTKSAAEGFNQFIDNPFSSLMQDINDWSENALPNYYTRAEQEEPWYENIFTANFLGDKFLKNTGFMVGAALGAYVTGGAGAKVFLKKGFRDAFKGTVVNAAGDALTSGKDIYKAYKAGDAFMDGVKLTEDLGKAAKQLKNAEAKIKILGAATSAMGEGRIEAINGAEDAVKAETEMLEDAHNKYINSLEGDLYKEHPEWFSAQVDSEGNPRMMLSSEEGIAEYQRRLQAEQSNYEQAKARISKDKLAIGNTIFSLNVPLLMGSNLWQFGRMISGGYTTGRISNSLAKGSIKEGFQVNKNLIRNKRLRALSSPLMEAQEEMSQASIQEGAGMWKASGLNNDFGSFYGGKIDPDAEADTDSWLNSISKGFVDTYTDLDRWEEGFIGGLTGFLGIPKISMKTNDKGKKRPSISLDGELWGGLSEANELKKQSEELVKKLNDRVQSKDFVNMYQGMIRHNNLQEAMNSALDRGSNFDFKNWEYKQLISDTMMFDKAGKLDELYDYIEQNSNITIKDVPFIREQASKTESGKSAFDGMTDQQVLDHVKKQADLMKSTVDKYVEVSNNLKTLYGDNISDDVLDELTWGLSQVDNWESRIKDLSKEVREPLQEKAQEIKDKFGVDVPVILNNLTDFTEAFSEDRNLIDEINNTINDRNLSVQEQREKIDALIKSNQAIVTSNNLALGRTINKIRRDFVQRKDALIKQRDRYLKEIVSKEKSLEGLKEQREEKLGEVYDEEMGKRSVIASLEDDLKELKSKFSDRNRKKFANRKDVKENTRIIAEIEEQIEYIKSIIRTKEKSQRINEEFEEASKKIENSLLVLAGRYNSDSLQDRRLKTGIRESDPNVLELQARRDTFFANTPLLSQIVALKEMLAAPENNISINPLESSKLIDSLSDLINLHAVRTKFIDTYQQLSENPELFTEAFEKQTKAALDKYVQKEVDKIEEDLNKITTLAELKEFLKDKPREVVKAAIERVKKGDNKVLKKLFTNLEEIEEVEKNLLGNEGVNSLIADFGESPELLSVVNLLRHNIEHAESVSDIFKGIDEDIEHLKEAAGAEGIVKILQAIKERYGRAKESSKSNKKDSNKAREVKGKGKTSSDEEKNPDDLSHNPLELLSTNELKQYIEARELDIDTKGKKFKQLSKEIIKALAETGLSNDEIEKDANEFLESLSSKDDEEEVTLTIKKKDKTLPEETSNGEESSDKESTEEEDKEDTTQEEEEKSELESLVDSLEDLDDEDLSEVIEDVEKAIKDNIINIQLSDDEKERKSQLKAIKELAEKVDEARSSTHSGSEFESGTTQETNSDSHAESTGNPDKFKSTPLTEYKITELKDKDKREKVFFKDKNGATTKLRELGAYDFVNEGRLADLLDKNPNLKIHYLLPPITSSELKGRILLAVEVNDENESMMLNPIEAGNGKRYQIVGMLGYYADNKAGESNYGEIWKKILDDLKTEGEKNDINDYYVTRFSNVVSHIYSGRMVKSSQENGVQIDKVETRNLGDIVNDDEEIYLGIYYSSTDYRHPRLSDVEVEPLNFNNANPREGSVWLITKEADGRYYSKAVGVKLFNEYEYDLDENSDSPILQEIRENLADILDSETSEITKLNAKLELKKLLYFSDESGILFNINDEGDTIVSIKNRDGKTIATFNSGEQELDEAVEEALEALQSPGLNLRFQVSPKGLEEVEYVDKLLKSNILTTDISQLHNVNASFEMPLLDVKTGKPLEEGVRTVGKGHTGKKGIDSRIASDTVTLNGTRYSIKIDGGDKTYKKGKEEIEDENTIAEIELESDIKAGTAKSYNNSSLYISTYNDGTEFGIINHRVLVDEELEEEKAKYEKIKKKKTSKAKVMEDSDEADWSQMLRTEGAEELDFKEDIAGKEKSAEASEDEDIPLKKATKKRPKFDWEEEEPEEFSSFSELGEMKEGGLEEEQEESNEDDEEEDASLESEEETKEEPKDSYVEKAKKLIVKMSSFNTINSSSVGMSTSGSNFLQYLAQHMDRDESPIDLIAKGLKLGIDIEHMKKDEKTYEAILKQIRCGKV